eukprot:1902184-Rhodomonas_salina.3
MLSCIVVCPVCPAPIICSRSSCSRVRARPHASWSVRARSFCCSAASAPPLLSTSTTKLWSARPWGEPDARSVRHHTTQRLLVPGQNDSTASQTQTLLVSKRTLWSVLHAAAHLVDRCLHPSARGRKHLIIRARPVLPLWRAPI